VLVLHFFDKALISCIGSCQNVSLTEDSKDPAARWRMEKIALLPKISESIILKEVELNIVR
jgi:hypothetical protein